MVKKILLALAALIAGLVILISVQPAAFSIERSAVMAAPPAAVFALVDDLAAWDSWSPWLKLDPNAKNSLSTPSSGKGATVTWAGNEAAGEGSMTILQSRPGELVELEQVFIEPFEGKARFEFTFAPEGEGTRVVWRMDGTNNFIGKAICLVVNLESSLGPSFEEGLANLKAVAEKKAAAPGA